MLKNRAEAIINTENLAHNFKKIRAMVGGSRVISVVKADAYGHGAAECAHVIERCGGDMFAVASADDGAALREDPHQDRYRYEPARFLLPWGRGYRGSIRGGTRCAGEEQEPEMRGRFHSFRLLGRAV